MTTATRLSLKTALGPMHGHLKAILDGAIQPEGASLELQDVPILGAFRSMCRTLNFDVCEMAVVTYFSARSYGIPMTAIPVFPLSNLIGRQANGPYTAHVDSGIKAPKDLEGKRLGVRSYTFTPGTWAKYLLKALDGVDLDKVNIVLNDEEHVEQYHADTPKNVDRRLGADLLALHNAGEIEAGILMRAESPTIAPAFVDLKPRVEDFCRRAGVTPVDHTVVIRSALLQEHPWLARAVYDAITAAKAEWRKRTPDAPADGDLYWDPMPVGLDNTRKTLEMLVQASVEAHVLKQPLDVDELFPGNLN